MKDDIKEKISQLQNIEQSVNSIIAQKQQFQAQNVEIENALAQVPKSPKVFRIIGNIMVASSNEEVKAELTEKKEIVELRLSALDKQEQKLRDRAKILQETVMKGMKNGQS